MRRRAGWGLALGDAVVLLGFVLTGMQTHGTLETGSAAYRFGALAAPLLAAWAAAATALGAWPGAGLGGRALLGRSLAAWLVAAPLALVARALLLGSATLAVPFVLVTLGLGGALLLAWRAVWVGLAGRRAGDSNAA